MLLCILVLFIAVFQDTNAEVIDDIILPNITEERVQCLDARKKIQCAGGEKLLAVINEERFAKRKEGYESFITALFIDYSEEMQYLLPSEYRTVTAVRDLWTQNKIHMFERVFKGFKYGDYGIRTGFFSRLMSAVLYSNKYVPTWKSDNCDYEDHCVQTVCLPAVRGVPKTIVTYAHNTNPFIDLMVLTAAIYKGVDKTFSSRKLTYRLTGGFLKRDNYVTVEYLITGYDYSIGSVKVAYYSLKSGEPLHPTNVCDNIIGLPDLGSNWTCDLKYNDSSDCRGMEEFINLRNKTSECSRKEAFINLVVGDKNYNNAISTYLGNDTKSRLYDLWFSEHNLFRNVFDDRDSNTKVKSGYLTFQYGDMKCRGTILYDISPGNCTAIYPKVYQIESHKGMNITYLNKVNPLFDFTALTLAAARGQLLKNLRPGKMVTLIANKSDECQIEFNLLSLDGYETNKDVWTMTNFTVGYKFSHQ